MKRSKKVTSFLLAGIIGGCSLGGLPLQASAAPIANEKTYFTPPVEHHVNSIQLETTQHQSTMMKWNLTVSSDTLGITQKMIQLLQKTTFQNVTRELTDQTFSLANNRYNVMVFTADSRFHYQFQGIKFHANVSYLGTSYDIYVFEKGAFDTSHYVETKPWAWAYKGWIKSNSMNANIQFYLPNMRS